MPPEPDLPRPSLITGRGFGGTLAWVATLLVAAVPTIGAARHGRGWGAAAPGMALALAYTFLPWIRWASDRAEARRRREMDGTLTVDEWGVTRATPKLREAVAWKDLAWVRIYTTADGPGAEDFFFALGGDDGKGCLVPNGLATTSGLLGTLQARLPGLDNREVARAAGSVCEACFTIWTRPNGQRKT